MTSKANEGFTRVDLGEIDANQEEKVRFSKVQGRLIKDARQAAQPPICLICGKPLERPCNSHTVPQYCLREIAVDGKVLGLAALLDINILSSEVGVKQAGIFKSVCRTCDTEFFKKYETPDNLFEEPEDDVLGQIAAKNLLRGIYKGRQDVQFSQTLSRLSPYFYRLGQVWAIDVHEDEKNLEKAIASARGTGKTRNYTVIYHEVLPYVVPIAFQGKIEPISDFHGRLLNNVYSPDPRYKLQALHICIFPAKGKTVVLVFRDSAAKRCREFVREFRGLSTDEKQIALLKLIFANSEEVYLSKRLPQSVFEDVELRKLARMNNVYAPRDMIGDFNMQGQLERAQKDFALDNLPTPPNLLSEAYAVHPSVGKE
jgi:ribosomal protein S14